MMSLRLGWSGLVLLLQMAYYFSGGPAPCQGLVLERGLARFRSCSAWDPFSGSQGSTGNAVDVHDVADVLLES